MHTTQYHTCHKKFFIKVCFDEVIENFSEIKIIDITNSELIVGFEN
jgi:hypothetical protein